MKKILATIALAAAMTTCAFAQDFGVRIGPNFNWMTNNTSGETVNLGMYVGVVGDIALPVSNLAIRVEPAYSMQGGAWKGSLGKTNVNLDYINVPVLVEYKLLGGTLNLMAGPQFGFALGGSTTTKFGDTTTKTKFGTDDLNVFDFGFGFGATCMILPNWGIDVRYYLGLLDATKGDSVVNKNSVLSIGACYMF